MNHLRQSVEERIEQSAGQYQRTITAVRQGRPLAAETDQDRVQSRIKADPSLVAQMAEEPPDAALSFGIIDTAPGPERVWGNSADFVGVAFLEQGVQAARAVGRVAWKDGSAQGSGFLVAPNIFLTNHHVIQSAGDAKQFVVEFDYEVGLDGQRKRETRFELAPTTLFVTDDTDDLDYTLIALGPRISGPVNAGGFGYITLSDAENKHALGEVANIVQHPDGRLKEVVLRENRLVSRLSHVLHYVADTEPGSSGSPVFNNQWQVIALHHWGGPWRQTVDTQGYPVPRYVNEGVRISAIVDELRGRRDSLPAGQRELLDQLLVLGESGPGVVRSQPTPVSIDAASVHVRPDGVAVWRIPIEITVGIPGIAAPGVNTQAPASVETPAPMETPDPTETPDAQSEAFKRKLDKNYDNRKGYQPNFLTGHPVPAPSFTAEVEDRLARNKEAEPGEDPFALPYQHFSIYVDGQRGLPLVALCNIDGKNLKSINRTTGSVSKAESLTADALPEAREKWYVDPRISPDECGDDKLYTKQIVSTGPNRTGRIFHRGHMVRRLDPCWGSNTRALRAEADTFHFTNCTPQVGKFNSGKTLWQGIENHVLENARVDDVRVSVFTGPVLADDDPPYRQDVFPGFQVPLKFFKIAVWVDDGELAALAMLADQTQSLLALPEGMEAIDDDEGVSDFISSVAEIERLTGLDFGEQVRNADIHKDAGGAEAAGGREVTDLGQVPLKRS